MTGINWFGFETTICSAWALGRKLNGLLMQVRSLGYNTIRLPYCNHIVDPGSSANSIDFGRNPELQGLTPIQLMTGSSLFPDNWVSEFFLIGIVLTRVDNQLSGIQANIPSSAGSTIGGCLPSVTQITRP